ncbi:MAG TPA: L,D-transpeptidase family protein [Burkholderiales bacterium]|nr:L,D-transpeptidase family protein [Burkholderiales bacterium]
MFATADPAGEALRARTGQLRAGNEVVVDGAAIAARRVIAEFYERRGFRPAWTAGASHALLAAVLASAAHGLDPNDYHAASLRKLAGAAPADAAGLASRELLMTDALVRLAYHLRFGKANPRELYPGWNYARSLGDVEPVDALEKLVSAASLEEAIERYAPQVPAYRHLRGALAALREIQRAGGWKPLSAGPALKPGMQHERVRALRERLAASGDLPTLSEDDHYDDELEAAVRTFQARHGLEPDGAAGRATLDALNVGIAARIDQVRANLERLRWVAQDLAGDYLIVDIAGFSAQLFRDGRIAWSSRAIVGRPYRRTPVFRARIDHLVLNPTWTVPPTILRHDVLPKIARDPRYLAKNDMQVVDARGHAVDPAHVDWARARAGGLPYQIVQAPGAANPLGRVKFLLPNPYSVYLHDTPSRELFSRPGRAFSSGCIRLERPLELAMLLLDDAEHWGQEALDAVLRSGQTRTLTVRRNVSVLLLYFTAEADGDGTVRFRPDLYRRDAQVLQALAAPFRFAPVDGGLRKIKTTSRNSGPPGRAVP